MCPRVVRWSNESVPLTEGRANNVYATSMERNHRVPDHEQEKEDELTMATDQTERYRQAAEDALGQLDWCIGYLHGIHKTRISVALARNRTHIRRALLRVAREPLPSQTTSQT